MSILDRITGKKKETADKQESSARTTKKSTKKTATKKATKKKAAKKTTKKSNAGNSFVHTQDMELLMTEKAHQQIKNSTYVFRVRPEAGKREVQKRVEQVYGVDVINVRMMNASRRYRTIRYNRGLQRAYKKAFVRIKDGQKISTEAAK